MLSSYAEFYDKYSCLPEVEELLTVYEVADEEVPDSSDDPLEFGKYQRKIEVLTWHLNVWLPMVVGVDWWGPHIRANKLLTDTTEVEGRQKVLVTKSSEAFGLLQYKNSRSRWIEVFKWKQANPGKGKQAPQCHKKDPSTHKFKSKWSDAKEGQCSGWDSVALRTFKRRLKGIEDIRNHVNCPRRMEFGRECIRKALGLREEEDGRPKKRRKVQLVEDEDDELMQNLKAEWVHEDE